MEKSKEILVKYQNFIIQRCHYNENNIDWKNFFAGNTFAEFLKRRKPSNVTVNAKYHLKISIYGALSIILEKTKSLSTIDKLLITKIISLLPYEISEKNCNIKMLNSVMDIFWQHLKFSSNRRKSLEKSKQIGGFKLSAIGEKIFRYHFESQFADSIIKNNNNARYTSKQLDKYIHNKQELEFGGIQSSTFSEFYDCKIIEKPRKKRKSRNNQGSPSKKQKLNENNNSNNNNNNGIQDGINDNNNNNCQINELPPNIECVDNINNIGNNIDYTGNNIDYTVYEANFVGFVILILQEVEIVRYWFEKGNIFVTVSVSPIMAPLHEDWVFKTASANSQKAKNAILTIPLFAAHIEKVPEVKIYKQNNRCVILVKNPTKIPKNLGISSSINSLTLPNHTNKNDWKELMKIVENKGYEEYGES